MLDVAARNFTFGEVATVMQLTARFSKDLDGIVAELQKSDLPVRLRRLPRKLDGKKSSSTLKFPRRSLGSLRNNRSTNS